MKLLQKQKSCAQSQQTINGAGATFPFPLIDTWRVAYQKAISQQMGLFCRDQVIPISTFGDRVIRGSIN